MNRRLCGSGRLTWTRMPDARSTKSGPTTASSSVRTLGVERSGKKTSLIRPPCRVNQTLLGLERAVPKPVLSPSVQVDLEPVAAARAAGADAEAGAEAAAVTLGTAARVAVVTAATT